MGHYLSELPDAQRAIYAAPDKEERCNCLPAMPGEHSDSCPKSTSGVDWRSAQESRDAAKRLKARGSFSDPRCVCNPMGFNTDRDCPVHGLDPDDDPVGQLEGLPCTCQLPWSSHGNFNHAENCPAGSYGHPLGLDPLSPLPLDRIAGPEPCVREFKFPTPEASMPNVNVKVSIPINRKWTDSGPKHEECETTDDCQITVSGDQVTIQGARGAGTLTFSKTDLDAALRFLGAQQPVTRIERGVM